MKTLTTAALIAALATPSLAGGPVIIEDTEAAPTSEQRPCIIGCLALAVIVIGVGVLVGSDNCNGPDDGGKC